MRSIIIHFSLIERVGHIVVIFLRGDVCAAPCDISWEIVCNRRVVEAAARQETPISYEGYVRLAVIKGCSDINMMPASDASVALAHG